jgi:DNA-directed RNA polymerase sigma subunit (sigma70/sigma32)
MTAATNPDYHMTYCEIAEVLGVSRQRVKQIEKSALDKLRRQYYPEYISSSSESHTRDQLVLP